MFTPKANDFSSITNTHIPLLVNTYGEELAAAQLQIEHDAYVEGEARFMRNLERAVTNGELADSKLAKPYLVSGIQAMTARIDAKWAESDAAAEETKAAGGRYRRTNAELLIRNKLSSDVVATITLKTIISQVMAKRDPQPLQAIAGRIGKALSDELRFGRIRDTEAQYFNKRIEPALRKRVGANFKLAYMQAVEAHMVEDGVLESRGVSWTVTERTQAGIFCLEALLESNNWFTKENFNEGSRDEYVSLIPTEEFSNHFTERAHNLAGMSPVYQPCVVPPRPWTDMNRGGYWAEGRSRLSFVRTHSKKARLRYKGVDMPKVYNAVNLAQNTAWQVNTKVLEVIEAVCGWQNPVGGIPATEEMAAIDMAATEGLAAADLTEQQVASMRKRKAMAHRMRMARVSQRISFEFTLSQARKFAGFDAIYFPHNLDWRGRIYAIPSFNPQGNDMTKGLLKFATAKSKPLGKDGAFWLAVHGANCMGYDKASLDMRYRFVEQNEEMILSCAANPLDDTRWAEQDSPWCFLAFCFEWAGYKQHGEDYVCGLPVALDGTCSGLQHFSAMLRDEVGGAAVNLTSGLDRQDIYGIVAVKVTEMIKADLIDGTADELVAEEQEDGSIEEKLVKGTRSLAEAWLAYGVTRSVTKRPVMTLAYGASKFGFTDQILEDTIYPSVSSDAASPFETCAHAAARYLAEHIWNAVSTTVVAAVDAMSWLQSAAKLMAATVKDKKTGEVLREALPITWVTPAGFPVWQEYSQWESKVIRTMFMGKMNLSLTIQTEETSKIIASKQAAGAAPNFVHSNDAAHLQLTVGHANETYGITEFALIHDSFGAMPADAGNLFNAVREAMVNMYENNDVLADFYDQFADQLHESQLEKMPAIPTKGNLDIRQILKSQYAFS